MKPYRVILAALASAAVLVGCGGETAKTTEMSIRAKLNPFEFEKSKADLVEMGEKAFQSYEAILADRSTNPYDVVRIFEVLGEVKADRGRFLETVVQRAADPEPAVRAAAAKLLGKIGGVAEGPPLVALLSNKDAEVVKAAAASLAAIGGSRELVAMDAWMLGLAHDKNPTLRADVKKSRDALAERVAKEPKKK